MKEIIKSDLIEAKYASENFLLASTKIKAISRLISSNICPESWALGFLSPPTSLAPTFNPELTTLNPGNPELYLRMLPSAVKAL